MKTHPLNNNVLIEVIQDYAGVSRNDASESMKYGKLINYRINRFHLTASAALRFSDDDVAFQAGLLEKLKGKIVRWEEYAETGQTFEQDGKTYALVPFWRLTAYEE